MGLKGYSITARGESGFLYGANLDLDDGRQIELGVRLSYRVYPENLTSEACIMIENLPEGVSVLEDKEACEAIAEFLNRMGVSCSAGCTQFLEGECSRKEYRKIGNRMKNIGKWEWSGGLVYTGS